MAINNPPPMVAWNHRRDRRRGCCGILSHPSIRGLSCPMSTKRTRAGPLGDCRNRTGSGRTRSVRPVLYPIPAAVAWYNPSCMIDIRGMSLPMSSISMMKNRLLLICIIIMNIWPVPKVRPVDPLGMCCAGCWKSFRNMRLAGGMRAMIEKQCAFERKLILCT